MRTPNFWHHKRSLWPRLLWPLGQLYRLGSWIRAKRASPPTLPIPVICVGNINMGGTGKTPTVIEVIGILTGMGITAHVVTRGYGGTLAGPVQVDIKTHTATHVGDEPLLLAGFAPTWVSKDRAAGAMAAQAAGAQAIVLDDGMQNHHLVKDFTLMVVDAEVGFGNRFFFPAGPLRQSVASGLSQADMALAIGPTAPRRAFAQSIAPKPCLGGHLKPLETGMDWAGLRVIAFAGIGRPQKFFDTLTALGADVVDTHSFGDHQQIPTKMMTRMLSEATQKGAQLVTTEKDAARLPKRFRQEALTLPVRLEIEDPAPLHTALAALVLPTR